MNNSSSNQPSKTKLEILKDVITDMIKEGKKPSQIIQQLKDDNIDTSELTNNIVRYIDNKRQYLKNKRAYNEETDKWGGPEKDEADFTEQELEDYIRSEFELLRMSWIVGKTAISKLKASVKNKFNFIIQEWHVVSILKSARDSQVEQEGINNAINELNSDIDSVKRYTVQNWNYLFNLRRTNDYGEEYFEEIVLPVKLVDWLFYDFSTYWNNLSWLAILQKYRLKPEVFAALKGRLWLYKASNVISPHTLEESTDEEVSALIENAVERSIQDKYKEKFVATYDKVFEKKAKEAFKVAWNIENVAEIVRESIKDLDPIKVDRIDVDKARERLEVNSDIAIFLTSDYHFWEDDDLLLEARLDAVLDDMLTTPEMVINWISLWDLAETFIEEWMHPGQVNRMEKQWFDLVKYVYQVFASRIATLATSGKKVIVDWQWGNHDRDWKSNTMDRPRTWALVVWEMIELSLRNFIEQWLVEFRNYKTATIRQRVWKLWIIANHGDWMFHKMKNSDVLAKFWFWSDTYHVILEWDKHHFIAKQDTNSIRVVTSSIKSGWQYAEEVIYKDSVPWYLKIKETKTWKANVSMKMFDI